MESVDFVRASRYVVLAIVGVLVGSLAWSQAPRQPGVESGRLLGRLSNVDSMGDAIGNVSVSVAYQGGQTSAPFAPRADGSFSVDYQGKNPVLVVSAPGYSTYRYGIRPGQRDVIVSLDKDVVVSGQLIAGRGGKALRGDVTLLSPHPRNFVSKSGRAVNGAFTFSDVLPGVGYVIVRAPDMGPEVRRVQLVAGTRLDGVNFELKPAASISGRVLDTAGNGVGGVKIDVEYELPSQEQLLMKSFVGGWNTSTDDGTFLLKGVTAGLALRLVASGTQGMAAMELPALSAGEAMAELRLQLSPR